MTRISRRWRLSKESSCEPYSKPVRAVAKRGAARSIPFVTAGDPDPTVTVPLMHALVEAGSDVLELGVPFSDPIADGPVIQRASERALAQGVNLHRILDMVREFRASNDQTPVVLMGYLNPFEVMGYTDFAAAAADGGRGRCADGGSCRRRKRRCLCRRCVVMVWTRYFFWHRQATRSRIALICRWASGYVYYVSLKGVTGAANLDTAAVAAKVHEIKQHTSLPVGVGFGIRDAKSAAAVAGVADAVVVGSVLVQQDRGPGRAACLGSTRGCSDHRKNALGDGRAGAGLIVAI